MKKTEKVLLIVSILLILFLIYVMFFVPTAGAEDFTQCSFYMENETCEGMRTRCTNQVTEIVKNMNFGLQEELEQCEQEIKVGGVSKFVAAFSALLLVFFLIREAIRRERNP